MGTTASDSVVLAVQAGGATLSGNIAYSGSQHGKLVVVAEQVIAGTLSPTAWRAVEGVVGNQFQTSTSQGTRYYRVSIP